MNVSAFRLCVSLCTIDLRLLRGIVIETNGDALVDSVYTLHGAYARFGHRGDRNAAAENGDAGGFR